MAGLSDTSPEAERVLLGVLRRMPFERRWRQIGEIYHLAKSLHAIGQTKGKEFTVNPPNENLQVLQEVIAALSSLGIPYALGGSLASCVFGLMRTTQDADLSVEPFPGKEAALCACFGEDYYISQECVEDAIRRQASFNIIHLISGFKVDCFIRKDRPFDLSAMARRRSYPWPGQAGLSLQCVTPEDVVLFKLEWYRLGDEASERQWRDIIGVLQVQAGKLDEAYLDHWAADLGVADLLGRARQDANG
jgi:hypothetical protein